MKRSLSSAPRGLRGLLRDKAGATAVLFGFMVVGLMGTAGLTFDVGQVFEYLNGYSALSFDDPGMVEGGDKGHFMFFGELPGCYGAVIEGVAGTL